MIMIRYLAVLLCLLLMHIPCTALARFDLVIPEAGISKQAEKGGEPGAFLWIYTDELQ